MTDFLLELRSEEIPARMQAGARAELEKLFRREMDAAGVVAGDVTVWSTPRRLALIARGLPDATQPVSEFIKGPRVDAPEEAIEGFLRSKRITRDQLGEHDYGKARMFRARVEKPGRATAALLADAISAIIQGFAWPKSMRWGAASVSTESLRWVRPLSGIVAILGEELVECAVDGIASGYATLGHRFHCPGEITIGGVDDYQEKLRACHVIVDHEERAALIRDGARKVAAEAGLTLVEDEGLVIENAGLTEWPVPLLGRFDEAFLDVPPEVIQLTARVNQKYFVCTKPSPLQGRGRSAEGAKGVGAIIDGPHPPTPSPKEEGESLANAFICTANITAEDPAVVVDGNRKVLAARLSDARFFWEQDRKTTLAEHAKKLERITFHEKLGTVADKVERVAKLARWLVEEGIIKPSPLQGRGRSDAVAEGVGVPGAPLPADSPHPQTPSPEEEGAALANLAEQAARLCKADLVTEMVGEFPELQGVMGGYYARAEGLDPQVADAIRDHYKPVGQGDEVPTAPVTVAVSLADKLDTMIGFFIIDQAPTGSKDPFGLRRSAIAHCALVLDNELRLPLLVTLMNAVFGYVETALSWVARTSSAIDVAKESADLWLQMAKSGQHHDAVKAALEHMETLKVEATAALELLRCLRELSSHAVIGKANEAKTFIIDRLKVQQREAGVRHDLIDAVFALGGEDDLVRLLARVHALQSFIGTEDGTNLLAGYKRAANILKKEGWADKPSPHPPTPSPEGEGEQEPDHTGDEDPLENVDDPQMREIYADAAQASGLSYTPDPAEKALIDALDAAEPRAIAAIEAEDFSAAMSALASLRAPIDRFFDEVTVNAPQEDVRASRLNLLARFRAAVHKVADFSQIEG